MGANPIRQDRRRSQCRENDDLKELPAEHFRATTSALNQPQMVNVVC
jgi:hypothetical protein